MKMERTAIFVMCGVIATVAIAAIAVIMNLGFVDDGIPEGIPADYFEVIDVAEASHLEIYVNSDTLDFNGDRTYIPVTTWEELPLEGGAKMRVLVLDMSKSVEDEFATPQQLDRLFEEYEYQIFIVNYENSTSSRYGGLVEHDDTYSNLITFIHDAYGNDTIGSMGGQFPPKR